MTPTDPSVDLTDRSPRLSQRWWATPYAVVAAGGVVIGCLSIGALILTPSPAAAPPFVMAFAVGLAMTLVGVVAIRRRRVESALHEAEATLRTLQEVTNELRLRQPDAGAPIRDPETLLFSRQFFDESLDREMRRAAREKIPLTVVMIHVAALEAAPDSVVSAFLQAAGAALRQRIRSFDIVCRYERQILGVLLPGLSERQSDRRAAELLATVRGTPLADLGQPSEDPLRASVGFAVHRRHDPPATSQSMLRRAYLALYESRADATEDADRPAEGPGRSR